MNNKLNRLFNKQRIIIVLAILAIGIIVIFSFYSKFIKEKHAQDIIKKRIDSLLSWSNESYIQKQDMAFAILEFTKSMAIETSNPKIIANVFNKEASFCKHLNHYPKAILAYKQAAKLYTKSYSWEKLAYTYFNLADIFKIIGEYSKSLEFCNKSLDLYQKLNDGKGIKRCYRIMGSVYKYLKAYDKSILFYKRSLLISQEEKDEEEIALAFNNLGTAYGSMGNDSLSLKSYQQSFNVYNTTKNPSGLSIYYNNIGSIYMRAKEYDKAIANFRLALKYRMQANDKRKEALILDNIGEYFYEKNQFDSSIYYYNQSLSIASKMGLKERISCSYLGLSKNYCKNNMPSEAYQELVKYIHVHDTTFNAEKSLEIAKIEANFDAYKEQLQSTNEKQKQRLLLIIYVLSILVFSFLFVLLIKRHRLTLHKQQEFNQTLVEEKSRMEENLSGKDKELITYSLQLAQKQEIDNALANRIRSEIQGSSGETKKKLQDILNNINYESQRVNIWEDFEIRFNQVNQHFYKNLLEKHPSLTQNEKRLCAFLKLNLTTKEITIITGQSPHSINVARVRLRKKLGLVNCNQNLFDFLQLF